VDAFGTILVTGESYGPDDNPDYTTIAYDAAGNELWTARYNGAGDGFDSAMAIAADASGNVYVTGQSYGGATDQDYATVAYDAAGNELWVATYNGTGNGYDWAYDIAADSSGQIYVTGGSPDTVNGWDYTTVAYDSLGNELWVRRYNGPGNANDAGIAMALDASGNVYVTGNSIGLGTDYDFATVAYDSLGTELWSARYNGPRDLNDTSRAIATDALGNVYVTGWRDGSGDYTDYATVAYDASGNELWAAIYDGPGSLWDGASDLAVDASGNIYVTGWSNVGGGNYDFATIAYDASGNELWVAGYDGPDNMTDGADHITIGPLGNIYVAGDSYGDDIVQDWATVAYDASGNELWTARYNGPESAEDSPGGIAVDASGNVYVTGFGFINDYPDYVTLKYPANPDLSVSGGDITFDPPSPCSQGDTVTCTATVYNRGTFDAADVQVAFYVNDPLSGGILIGGTSPGNPQTIPFIPVGGSADVSITRVVPIVRTGDIYVWVDPPDAIAEWDEANNIAFNSISVGPDLTLESSDIIFTPDPGTAGSPVTIEATIHNVSNQDVTDSFRVRFYHGDPLGSGVSIGQKAIPGGIPAGGSETVAITGTSPVSGSFDIYVWADHRDDIAEYDEDNNMAFNTAVVDPLMR